LSQSISFDRAAGYYDDTRSLPDSLMSRLIEVLANELPPRQRCLEIGVGTGRIALPLMKAGVRIVGVDISREMLLRLQAKAGAPPPPVAIADATGLPFGDNTFGSAIASHVLHLIPSWRSAVNELLRVVRRPGVVVASRGGRGVGEEWTRAVRRHFFEAARSEHRSPGADRIEEVDLYMRERGAEVRELRLPGVEGTSSVAEVIGGLEAGYFSACWAIDDETRRVAAVKTREWAAAEFGDLDAKRTTHHESQWRSYALP
jgi:SAM-dependent methyltransferase